LYGRRSFPTDADPYVLRDVDLPALRSRLEGPGDVPSGPELRSISYTLLLWHVHSILSVEDEDTRAALYEAAEALYRSLLSEAGRSGEPDRRLESNASFLIGAAWVAWKGTLDTLAKERLQKSSALKEGQYRLAAEMLAEKTPFRPDLQGAVAKLLEGDAAAALSRIDDALKKKPDDPSALYWRGVALLKLDRPSEAIVPLDACLASRPKEAPALEARAACRYALKQWKLAVEDWELVLTLDPGARGRLQPFVEAVRQVTR
jgi:tetratricopeptide (TPR) repeat protein